MNDKIKTLKLSEPDETTDEMLGNDKEDFYELDRKVHMLSKFCEENEIGFTDVYTLLLRSFDSTLMPEPTGIIDILKHMEAHKTIFTASDRVIGLVGKASRVMSEKLNLKQDELVRFILLCASDQCHKIMISEDEEAKKEKNLSSMDSQTGKKIDDLIDILEQMKKL